MISVMSAEEILKYLEICNVPFEYKGDKNIKVTGFSALDQYKIGTFTWIKSEDRFWGKRGENDITLAFVQKGVEVPVKNQIICETSKEAFFSVIEHYYEEKREKRIGNNSVIGEKVVIGKSVCIGNNCSIDGDIHIGDGTVISDNVVIRNRVRIGERCYIQACSVIGEDGFGYYEDEKNVKTMIKHHGGVKIGNDVFIGAHVNIARGTISDTCIGDGAKIAPSTHIGHNGIIGNNATVICSQLYGSVQIDDNVYVVGSIIRNQIHVGKNSLVGMGSVVTKDVDEGCIVYGSPAKVIRNR